MPIYKRKRTYTPKKDYKKRYKRRTSFLKTNTSLTTPSIGFGMPDRMKYNFKYSTTNTVSGTNSIAIYVMRGNSPYDPDYTGVGTQPPGWDELNSFFWKYTVTGSKIEVLYDNSTTIGLNVIIVPLTTTTVSTFAIYNTMDRTKKKIIGNVNTNNTAMLSSFAKTGSVLGIKDVYSEGDLACSASANPVLQWFWHVFLNSTDNSTLISVAFTISVTYYGFFSHKKVVSYS